MSKLMNAKQYEESLRKLKLNVYMFGKKVKDPMDDPIIRPSMNAVAATYEFAHRPEYEDIMTVKSHITGKKINRFTHVRMTKPRCCNIETRTGVLPNPCNCGFLEKVGLRRISL